MTWPKFIVDWVEKNSKTWSPVPIVKWGYVSGPTMRWEKQGGGDTFLALFSNRWLKNVSAKDAGLGPDWGPTHLQKQSKWGILRVSPFCLHVWYQFREQLDGQPGTELCLYWRFGKARWDAGDGKYIKPTWYGPGLNWD